MKMTRDEARRLLEEGLPELLASNPEAIAAAMGNDTDAMKVAFEKAGFSVTERESITPADVLEVKDEMTRSGRLDAGFGSAIRARVPHQRYEDPITGTTSRTYLWGETQELAEAWWRAFFSKGDSTDYVTGKTRRELFGELEERVRAPADPFLGDVGEAAGSLVPTLIQAEIFEQLNELFVMKGLVQIFTSPGPLDVPRRVVEVTVSRGGVATDLTEDKPELGHVHLAHNRVGVVTYIDPRLAAAAAVGPVRWVTGQIAEALAKDDQRTIIAGTESDSEPRGVLGLPTSGGNAFDRMNTVAYDNTDAFTERSTTKEAFYAIGQQHRIKPSFMWVANNDGLRELTTHNDTNQTPWTDEGDMYLRKRVIESLALTTAASATTILGGDWSQYAWLEHPLGLRMEQSTVGGRSWESDTIGVKAVQYVDGAPIIPPAFVSLTSVDV